LNTFAAPTRASHAAREAESIATAYQTVRGTTRRLCTSLTADDQMVQSTTEASPVKWHQAHTTWFFETFLLVASLPGYRPFSPAFRSLFNSYYKQVGAHPLRTLRSTFSRPSLEEVQAYRHYVDEHMAQLFASDVMDEAVGALVRLGINHEQQHQELILTDIKHAFWTSPLRPAYLHQPSEMKAPGELSGPLATPRGWRHFPGGLCQIGNAGVDFAFDNEGPQHLVYLQPFRLAARLVTNREYLQFMQEDGYRRPGLWLSDGWDTALANRWEAPLYWERDGDGWTTFTLAGMRPLDLREPVCHVSYYEADAFARWAGARLPSEAEWEIAAQGVAIEGNFLEQARLHPAPAPTYPSLLETDRLQQLFGDVWEWTQSPYVAYPGFTAAAGPLGEYNGKFMCNQLVLRGGSCATPETHIRASYRNFFPPASRWQFMGIRLAE
jgi:ergothioneine biosynthesis protein EgtB